MKNVEIPPFLRHLKVDERGYVTPFFVPRKDGKNLFQFYDAVKREHALKQNLCGVCGKKNTRRYAFITGPEGAASRCSSEAPMHLACAEYSLQVCPHLKFEKTQRRELREEEKNTLETPGFIAEKPSELHLIFADKWWTFKYKNFTLIGFRPVSSKIFTYKNGILTPVA